MTGSHPSVFFVEHLTLRSWFGSILPWLFAQAGGPRPQWTCYVIEGSPLGFVAARLCAGLMGLTVTPLEFQLNEVRDREGLHARIRIQHIDIDRVQLPILSSAAFQIIVKSRPDAKRLGIYLAKSMAVTSLVYERDNLFRGLLVVQICDWKMRETEQSGEPAVLFLERRPWFGHIQDYATPLHLDVIGTEPWLAPLHSILNRVAPTQMERLRELRYRGLSALLPSPRQTPIRPRPVAVEYYGQLNLNKPELHSDLALNQQHLMEGGQVNAIFHLPMDPLDDAKRTELVEQNIGSIATHPGATTLKDVPAFRSTRRLPKPLNRSADSAEERWLRAQASHYDRQRIYWESLFQTHGTKVFVTWNKYDARHCAITDALENLGGASVCYQRSHESNVCLDVTPAADVNLVWGRRDLAKEHFLTPTRCYVTVGLLGDHRFPLQRATSDRLRTRLQQNGASRILSFFDENSSDDGRWYYGHSLMREAYTFLLEKLLEIPWLGLVLKPKVPRTLRHRLGPVAELMKQAEATGRCIVLEGGSVLGSHPPPVAAMASDLAIHGHLWAGTAAVEAVLAGTPTLLMDREGWSVSPLCDLGTDRVVFNDWPVLWDACLEHWSLPAGVPGFGGWESVLDELDPFRDGRALERMGMYIRWLLEALEGGADRDAAIERASRRYAAQWGRDNVQFLSGRLRTEYPAASHELVETNPSSDVR